MKQPYRWRCFACDKPNEPSATSCAWCGFSARATGAEIDKARAAVRMGGSPALVTGRPRSEGFGVSPGHWSGWRKGLAIAGMVLLAISGFAWSETLTWPRFALCLLAFMFGAALLLVACVARDGTRTRAADAHPSASPP